ncbi:MAG TPA: GGDEF domain-containing protein [Gemmatimonadaceae bacterium]|nr:GGDEF domain-containing protein [Gemmatimonadaceae bacterium]
MAIKKRSKLKAKVAAKAKAVRSAVLKARPLARVLDQSKGVQGKVKTAGINLGRVNKVLKEETKTGAPAAAMVEALEKSADVEEKVQEAADELVVVNEALSGEIDARHAIEERLLLSHEALAISREQAKRARHESLHDEVTGLPNAALFRDRLKSALAQARRHSWRIAVMFIDLDGFKQVNDTYGHDMGDALLQLVAERLQAFVRGGDTVSRRSGDEFLFLMLEAKDEDNARAMAQRIIEVIAQPVLISGVELSVTASVGLAMYPGDGTTVAMLLKNADLAMYEAKGRLKKRVR